MASSESESSVLAAAAGGEAEAKAPEGAAAAAAAPPAAASGGFDSNTKKTVQKIPLLKTRAGPRDGEAWTTRLKEEYMALITYIKNNKENDNDWFTLKSDKSGNKWEGKCWYYYQSVKYEFDVCFDIPVTYPTSAPEIAIPELDGTTSKMYRGGKICLTIHFNPLWAKNVPRFGIAHAMALGLGPWLAAEVPSLVERGIVVGR
eukprot:g1651.t1